MKYYGLVEQTISLKGKIVDTLTQSNFFWLAAVVAGIGATVYTAKTCASIMNGHQFNVWELLKPLLICLFCVNFRIVISVLDFVPNGISMVTADVVYNSELKNPSIMNGKQFFQTMQQELNKNDKEKAKALGIDTPKTAEDVEQGIQSAGGEKNSDPNNMNTFLLGKVGSNERENVQVTLDMVKNEDTFLGKLKAFINGTFGTIVSSAIGEASQWVLGVMNFVFPLVITVSQIMLAILSFLGPFVLAFSVFPGFGGFKSWCTRYMHTAFWMPMTYILHWIYLTGIDSFTKVEAGLNIGDYSERAGAMLIFGLATFFNIFKIPTLSTYIVESAISSGLAGAPGVARSAARMLLNRTKLGKAVEAGKKIVTGKKS